MKEEEKTQLQTWHEHHTSNARYARFLFAQGTKF